MTGSSSIAKLADVPGAVSAMIVLGFIVAVILTVRVSSFKCLWLKGTSIEAGFGDLGDR